MSDIERVRSALAFIPPDDRDLWVRMGMAIKSEFGDAGLEIWDAWSRQSDSYNAKDMQDVWRSLNGTGGVTAGTLFHEAKARGWHDNGTHQKPTPEEVADRGRIAAERTAKEEAEKALERAQARQNAEWILKVATPAQANHAYLLRKGVSPVPSLLEIGASRAAEVIGYPPKSGDEPLTGRLLVVPIYVAGELSSLEFIDEAGRKSALSGGTKAGGHWAAQPLTDGEPNLLVGEGVATVLSAKVASGIPGVAVLSCGNLDPVARAMRQRFPEAVLVILADLDKKTGLPNPHAIAAARAVGRRLAVPAFGPDRPEWASDFNDMHQLQGLEVVAECIAAQVGAQAESRHKDQDGTPPGPRPLQREIPPGTPFPIDALGKVLGDAARKMQSIIQAPAAICGNSLLAAADLATQAHGDIVIDGRVFPISEMFVTVGQTGERKSEADKVALRPHREHERNLAEKYGQDLLVYQRDHEAYEKAKQEALGSKQNKSYDAKKKALADLGKAPVRPLEPLLLCEEPTYEGLVKLLAVGQPSVGLFSDEGGRFIGGHGMNSDNLLKTAAGLSGLWDRKPIDRVRVGDGSTKLYGRRVSLHLMVQPEVSQLILSNPVLIGQGLLSRCLVTWPESTAGTRLYCEGDLSTSPEIAAYNTLMKRILETTPPLADGARNELAPRHLPLASDAKRLWVKFHDHVERQLAEGGKLASVRGLGNKAPEHAARLAGVLALVKDIHVAHIGLEHMKAGIALVTHYLNEALRLYEAGVQDPQLSLAQKLLGWLKARGQPGVTLPEIYQLGPRPIRNARMARLLMGLLEEHGYVQAIKESSEHRGIGRREAGAYGYELQL